MNDDPLRGFHTPEPPPGLREAALGVARARFAHPAIPAADLWTRLYRSRAGRLAWAASVVLLAAAHLAVSRRADGPPALTAPLLDPEVGAIARLPRISEQAASAYSGERS